MSEQDEFVTIQHALASHGITDDAAVAEWVQFSRVQAANCLAVDAAAVERFLVWRQTRRPEDAWS